MNLRRIQKNRQQLDLELRDSPYRQYFSPLLLCLYSTLIPRLESHATGRLLDAGCGTMPFRLYLEQVVSEYHALDIERKVAEVNFVADICRMDMLASESYETVLSSEVLEHVSQPSLAIAEIYRVLKPQGKFILTVPYLGRLHEEPHDYFRYTEHGLRFLLESRGFRVIEIVPTGSLFSFLGHQFSTLLVGSVWHIPLLKRIVFWANTYLCTWPCYWLDQISRVKTNLPLGYVAVAEKP